MAYSVDTIQDQILDYVKSQFVQPVYDDYIPNTSTLRRGPGGEVNPYIVMQFGDLQPQSSYSFVGPEGDDYGMPVYVQAISADPKVARRLANKVLRVLLGHEVPWSGQMRKRPGFQMFTIDSSDNALEAYACPVFFTLLTQVTEFD